MTYQWKTGTRAKADAQVAGEMCERLAEEGRLTAEDLLDENRPEDAPLHGEFEWNDGIAAEEWRKQQARNIINHLVVVRENVEPVRGFFQIERKTSAYQPIGTILRHADQTNQLLDTALRELTAFQRKYNALCQLSKVFDAISEAKAEYQHSA